MSELSCHLNYEHKTRFTHRTQLACIICNSCSAKFDVQINLCQVQGYNIFKMEEAIDIDSINTWFFENKLYLKVLKFYLNGKNYYF